jgi:succinoglycan biosynthesis transport protein ExoP
MKTNGFVKIASSEQGTAFAEAYGLLLASVLLGNNGKPPSTVAVAAAQKGDGTSTTALNLALMMARSGRPTILVDANMRDAELHTAFGVQQAPGLAEVLTGKVELKGTLARTSVPNLTLLPAGKPEIPAQALLVPARLADIFAALRDRFDLVVIDTPPLLRFSDGLHVAKAVDGVLVVVPAQNGSRRDQVEAHRLLGRVEARILGTVLNRVPVNGHYSLARAG